MCCELIKKKKSLCCDFCVGDKTSGVDLESTGDDEIGKEERKNGHRKDVEEGDNVYQFSAFRICFDVSLVSDYAKLKSYESPTTVDLR